MSDLVLTCGTSGAGADAIRLEANLSRAVSDGEMLSAYFEVYGLEQGEDGVAKFEYEYHVIKTEAANRNWLQRTFSVPAANHVVTVQREEMQHSSLRRQFLSITVQQLEPGAYQLEVMVRDRIGRTRMTRRVEFERVSRLAHDVATPARPASK